MNKFIFTSSEKAQSIASYELKRSTTDFKFEKWLATGVGLFSSQNSQEEIFDKVKNGDIIFVRHLFEVNNEVSRNEKLDFSKMIESLSIDENLTFSVQVRFANFSSRRESEKNITEQLSNFVAENGLELDVKNPMQTISVFVAEDEIFIGCSKTELNLSRYKGGEMHFSEKENFVSRAEFKLLEAFEIFNIDLTQIKSACDLGCSPGGWSKALLSKGISVAGVDPARMEKDILNDKLFTHYQETAGQFLRMHKDLKFDFICSDMKIDIDKMISLMFGFEKLLNSNGQVILTFKLQENFSYKTVLDSITYLKKSFMFIGARQLFHNRHEITVYLRKKIN